MANTCERQRCPPVRKGSWTCLRAARGCRGDEELPLLPPSRGAVGCWQHWYLVLVDLGQHGVEDKAGWGCDVQALLGQREPVDEVLEGVLEVRGQGQRLLQLCLPQRGGRKGGEGRKNTTRRVRAHDPEFRRQRQPLCPCRNIPLTGTSSPRPGIATCLPRGGGFSESHRFLSKQESPLKGETFIGTQAAASPSASLERDRHGESGSVNEVGISMATAAAPQIYSGLRPPRPLFYLITGQKPRMESAWRRIWPAVLQRSNKACLSESREVSSHLPSTLT